MGSRVLYLCNGRETGSLTEYYREYTTLATRMVDQEPQASNGRAQIADAPRGPLLGKPSRYVPGGDWPSYTEQMDFFFVANGVSNAQHKKAILLTNVPTETFQLIKDLLAPTPPSDGGVTYEQIVQVVKDHVKPEQSPLVSRYEFDTRVRKSTESVSDFVKVLRHLAAKCKFHDDQRNERLRDRFIAGIKDDRMLRALLGETLTDLTFDKAVQRCVAMEQASRDVETLRGEAGLQPRPHEGTVGMAEVHQMTTGSTTCYRCGGAHEARECRFRTATCFRCQKQGHVQRMCRTKPGPRKEVQSDKGPIRKENKKKPAMKCLEAWEKEEHSESDSDLYNLFSLGRNHAMEVQVQIERKPIVMELDTGAAVSVISHEEYKRKLRQQVSIKETDLLLHTYTGETVKPMGVCTVNVEHNHQKQQLPLYVLPGKGPALLGREWLKAIRLQWSLLHLNATQELEDLLARHPNVFGLGLGRMKGIKARIALRSDSTPRFWKARPVAFARKKAVEQELDRLESEDVIERVQHSEWAAPIVTPVKKGGNVRICGDFKVTVNPQLEIDTYPLPRIEEIYAGLGGGKHFTVIDLKQAYLQMELQEDSQLAMTINTHRGLYRFKRLPFGVASAPAIWQRAMEQVLMGIPGTRCYLDDIIITGHTLEDHLTNLEMVLHRLEEYGLKANKEKCKFLSDSVEYCGHIISAKGLHTSEKKTRAITQMPVPSSIQQLRSFLGMIQYYARFLPNLSTELAPLHDLLKKDAPWEWGEDQGKSFTKVKQMLLQDRILTHFDPGLPVTLACDSSSYGLGAVLSHMFPDGSERPIAYASRSLSGAEKQYAQIEKEALALYWGVKKFRLYLEGHRFTLITDHQPLKFILSPDKAIPVTAAARLQRWSLFLGAFTYDIQYRPTGQHANCDGLSRLPVDDEIPDRTDDTAIFYNSIVDTLPVTAKDIERASRQDRLISQVMEMVQQGGQSLDTEKELIPFNRRRNELITHQGVLMWGSRVVVPTKLRARVLETLHEGHPGMVKMKGLARSFVWWPGIDGDIEREVRHCVGCQENARTPGRGPLHRWEYPAKPWQRLHVDFAGPLDGQMYLLVIDAYSKWPEIFSMRSTVAEETVATLRTLFARLGLPDQVISDNGPQFTSECFRMFMCKNGIRHVTGAPYHPATNGQAERLVQSFKRAMKAEKRERTAQHKLDRFLLSYRNSPQATTGQSPAQLLLGRNIKSRLDLVKPSVEREVNSKLIQNEYRPPKGFAKGQAIWFRNYHLGPKWLVGTVEEQTGPVSYRVATPTRTHRLHADQMRSGPHPEGVPSKDTGSKTEEVALSQPLPGREPVTGQEGETQTQQEMDSRQEAPNECQIPEPPTPVPEGGNATCTRSGRRVLPPARLAEYVTDYAK